MATVEVGDLLVRLEAQTAEFDRNIKRSNDIVRRFRSENRKAAANARSFGGGLEGIRKGFRSLKAAAPVAIIGGVGAAFGRAALDAARFGRDLESATGRVGFAVEELQAYRLAGRELGLDNRIVDTALQRFNRRIGEAAVGTGVLFKETERYKIELRDSENQLKSTETLFREYADVVAAASSQQEQLRLAVQAFDIDGSKFVDVLRRGSAGLDEFIDRSAELNSLTSEQVAALARQSRAWEQFATSVSNAVRGAFADLALFLERQQGRAPIDTALGLDAIEARIAEIEARLARSRGRRVSGRGFERLENELAALQARLEALQNPTPANTPALAALEDQLRNVQGEFGKATDRSAEFAGIVQQALSKDLIGADEAAALVNAIAAAYGKTVEASEEYKAQLRDIKRAEEERAKSAATARDIIEGTRTAEEQYAESVAELNALYAAEQVNAETVSRRMSQLGEEYLAAKQSTDAFKESQRELREEQKLIAEFTELSLTPLEEYLERLAELERVEARLIEQGVDVARVREAIREEFERAQALETGGIGAGIGVALDDLKENAKSTAEIARDSFVNAFDGMADAIGRFVQTGKFEFGDFTRSVIADLIQITVRAALLKAATSLVPGLGPFLGIGSANGNAFGPMGLQPFAAGGVVNSPTVFGFRNGVGLMGEAGPEAILPLRRGTDGRLGVEASGATSSTFAPSVTVNVISAGRQSGDESREQGDIIGQRVRRELRAFWLEEARNQARPGGFLSRGLN